MELLIGGLIGVVVAAATLLTYGYSYVANLLVKIRDLESRLKTQQAFDLSGIRRSYNPDTGIWTIRFVSTSALLTERLEEAIDREDYEEAARIRDLMKKG